MASQPASSLMSNKNNTTSKWPFVSCTVACLVTSFKSRLPLLRSSILSLPAANRKHRDLSTSQHPLKSLPVSEPVKGSLLFGVACLNFNENRKWNGSTFKKMSPSLKGHDIRGRQWELSGQVSRADFGQASIDWNSIERVEEGGGRNRSRHRIWAAHFRRSRATRGPA